jgi:hypothetical protein
MESTMTKRLFKAKILPNGAVVEAVYSDHIPYRKLGKMETKQGAKVFFDTMRQKWLAIWDNKIIASHVSREQTVALEKQYFEDHLI